MTTPTDLAHDPARTAILVSGMHRSGTSLLTRVLSLLGATLPATLIPGREEKNDADYWEGRHIVDLNQRIINSNGSWWGGWQRLGSDRLGKRDELVEQAREVIRTEFGSAELIVIKDPRVSRLIPVWAEALEAEGYRCAHVLALRDPGRVAASLKRRDGLTAKATGLGWLAHVLDAEIATREAPRVVVSLDNLVDDWRAEIGRIESSLGLTWPKTVADIAGEVDGLVDPKLAHRASVSVPHTGQVSAIMKRWAVDDVRPHDLEVLDRWRAELEPIRTVPSATAHIRRRGGRDIARVPGWRTFEHEGYNREAAGAFQWLTDARRSAREREAGAASLRKAERRITRLTERRDELEARVAELTAPSLPRRAVRRLRRALKRN